MLDEQRLIQRDRRRWVQLVAACALSILARDSIKEGPDVRPPPVPRTGESRAPAGPRLFIYVAGRASDMEINVRVGALIRSSDALAFAFINPSDGRGRSHLMIFAHDPTGRVYWFWPDWQDESVNPAALPIPHSDDAVELGEAVRHSFAEGPLTVVGLFSDRAWSAREVEATLAAGGPFAAADTDIWTETLEVVP